MVDKSLQRASKKLMAYLDANAGNNPAYHDAAIYIRILQADVEAQRKAKEEARRAAADAEAAAIGLMAERDKIRAELEQARKEGGMKDD